MYPRVCLWNDFLIWLLQTNNLLETTFFLSTNQGDVLLWLCIAWSTPTTLSVCIHAGGTEWAWNHGTCIHCMPGVSKFEFGICFHDIMCCFLQLLTCTIHMNEPVLSRVQEGNLTRFFLCKCWSSLRFFQLPYPSKSLHNEHLCNCDLRMFTALVVRRTLLGTDGFSGSGAPAAINGGHQEALTSPSFCEAESILISGVQIKIKPLETYHPLGVLQTEYEATLTAVWLLEHLTAWRRQGSDSWNAWYFWKYCCVCSNP